MTVRWSERRFSALDGDLASLATRLWGTPGLAAVLLWDNRDLLDYNGENVKPGMVLQVRDVPSRATTYVVQVKRVIDLHGGRGEGYFVYVTETVYEIAEKVLGSRYLADVLVKANQLEPPYELHAYRTLKIPALAPGSALRLAAEAARARQGWEGSA